MAAPGRGEAAKGTRTVNLPVGEVVRPASLPEAVAWLSGHPEARPITGGTDPLVQLRDVRRRAAARDVEGVEAVLTAADVPGENLVGVIFPDQPLLVADRVRMVGYHLAQVAVRTPEAAWYLAALVRTELDPLPAVHDPVAALRPGAARVPATGNLIRTFVVRGGDTPRRRAEVVIEAEHRIGGQEHTYLEPQGSLAVPEGRRRITIIASCQCPLCVQQAVRRVLGLPFAAVVGEMAARRVEAIATGWHRTRSRRFDPATGTGAPYEFYAIARLVACVEVDAELGLVRVRDVAAAHDVGTVLHHDALEGQIQGGVVQGVDCGTTAELMLDRGRLLNPIFTDYLIPTAAHAPEIKLAIVESDGVGGPFGAKGIGEPSLIPAAAAVRNAVCGALGIEIDRLALSPPAIVAALGDSHPFAWVADPEQVEAHGGPATAPRNR